ncbi:MAG: D-glycerate dehydrogenase [Candidatus Heimdallarchaeota archaeon]|nr:D-glycerate dehydrogenase [Candidatus Heimdallarchaeota archaeon]
MSKIVITRRIPELGIDKLRKTFPEAYIDYHDSEVKLDLNELRRRIRGAQGIIALLDDQLSSETLAYAPNLKVIANFAVGYNNIDTEYCKNHGIYVTNTPDILTGATADLAMALVLSVTRRIVEADRYTREGKFSGWGSTLMLGTELRDKLVGVFGAGRIGTEVIKRLIPFGPKIIYTTRAEKEHLQQLGAKYTPADKLLKQVDVLIITAPLTTETKYLINFQSLRTMKRGVFIINVGRGPIIEESALVHGLSTGRIAGAGLDVYEFEPIVTEDLKLMDNVVILPHIGSATHEARNGMSEMVADAVISALKDERPQYNVY